MNKPARLSFVILAAILVLTGWLRLGSLLLSVLFSYFVLDKFQWGRKGGKTLAVILFLTTLAALSFALTYFIHATVKELPNIAERAVPAIIKWATDHQIELPFTDLESLKDVAFEKAKNEASSLGEFADFARGATEHFVFLAVGCIVAIGLFLRPGLEVDAKLNPYRGNLYSLCCKELDARCATFYRSFAMVMNAQISISAINTVLTGVFMVVGGLPHLIVAIGVTFLCGFLPVIGNLISNILVVAIGFTVSPAKGLAALIFLICVHKLEYFLNSKIIGDKIRSPIWLTLIGLVLGEKLMGVAGMVLAPVILHYVRIETSKVSVDVKHN